MITITVRDYNTAEVISEYNKSYIPPTNLNVLELNNKLYFVVETCFNLDNDEVNYFVTLDRVVTKHLSQLTLKNLLV